MKRLQPQPGLCFDAEAHSYHLDGVALTSVGKFCEAHFWQPFDRDGVSEKLAAESGQSPAFYTNQWDAAAVTGSNIHHYAALLLDPRTDDEATTYALTFDANSAARIGMRAVYSFWRQRIAVTGYPRIVGIEQPIGYAPWGLAGTPDLILSEAGAPPTVPDYKCHKHDPARCWPDRETGELPTLRGPFAGWPDTKLNRTAIQTGCYRALLKAMYDLDTAPGFLLWVPTDKRKAVDYEMADTLPALIEYLETVNAPTAHPAQ